MVSDEGSDGTFRDIDPYTSVKDSAKDESSYPKEKLSTKDFDPYSKVKEDPYSKLPDDADDPYNKVDDPYNKVKDDDPYSKVKGDDPYNKVKGDDPYNKVKGDDPYNKVKGDDPYNKVKGDDPYNKVKGDDPYNRVNDEDDIEDPYNRVKDDEESAGSYSAGKAEAYKYSKVDINRKNKDGAQAAGATLLVTESGNFSVQSFAGEYAQVVKNKNQERLPVPPTANKRFSDPDPYALPPEPPRRYNDPVSMDLGTTSTVDGGQQDVQSSHTEQSVPTVTDVIVNVLPVSDVSTPTAGASGKREPPYHKLTARESMASINARRAMNMYEEVRDTENMYATVEGGSGDGVITKTETKSGVMRDGYAEIGATGGRGVHESVPAPPSLDSLHLMAKMDGKQRLSGEIDGLPDHPQKSPGSTSHPRQSGGINGFPETSSSNGMVNPAFDGADSDLGDITLDPNYMTVRDCIPDSEGDMDPNYESVEEAKAKANFKTDRERERELIMERKKRAHVYEVVETSEAEKVKERVLRSHMYEDLDGVQFEKQKLNNNQTKQNNGAKGNSASNAAKRNSEIWKRRSDVDDEKL
ncbi:hypothetical protein FSP39_000677 [Pinctada imbricata]|uniref:Uncharacterized protein n=1 Tax=Pinctada imbricata TaxID=66713 RepID=A0AA88XQY4_PINIB|nr:hypothetical protein FSP39_000677 [Pinctada imbricata]